MFIQKLKNLNNRITEATKDVKFKSWFPLLLYIITFVAIDFFAFFIILRNPYVPVETYFSRIIFSNIIALSSIIFMFGKKTSAILYAVFSVFLLLYSCAQMFYSNANKVLFRIKAVFSAKEGAKFVNGITKDIPKSTIIITAAILVFIAIATFLILKFSESPKKGVPRKFKYIVNSLIFLAAAVVIAFTPKLKASGRMSTYGSYQAYNYIHFESGTDVYRDMDIVTYIYRDIVCTVKQQFFTESNTEIIDDYFNNKPEHTDNDKTGIFKGKNLMIIQMESLEYSAIDEESCPNISKLMKEGINFKNFYSSRFGDTFTFGTETAIDTGLFAPSGVSLSNDYVNNSFPDSLARLFKAQGYSANEFHFNDPEYYNRGVMSKVYGYDNYIRYEDYAENKDQNFEIDDTLVTDNGLYNKLIENDRFLDFIVTYSAHLPFTSDDELYLEAIKRHPNLEADDPNDQSQIFRAKASLTDDMIGKLIERLDQDGKLDNTVLLFVTDHYCASIRPTTFEDGELSNTPCFMYAKGIKAETVEKVCNTGDILPTLVNMFDIGDCNKYMGSDIFDDSYEGYAYFQNLSWITSDFYYLNGQIEKNYTGKEVDEEFINQMNETIKNKINVNNQILFSDYYKDK